MMQDDKNIEIIMAGLEKANKAVPSAEFLAKMEGFARAYSVRIESFSRTVLLGMAASLLLLFAVNIYAVNHYSELNKNDFEESSVETYHLIPTKTLYE